MTEEVFRYPDEDDADHERNGNTPEENLRLAWYRRLPSARLSHLKFYAFLQLLLFCDILAVAQCALSVATKGPSVDILFGFEAAILLVSALMTQGLYHLHVVDGVMGVFAHLAEGSHHHNAIGELAEASEHGGSDEATREGEGAGDRDQAQQQQQQPKSFAKLFVERMANPWRDRRATLSFAIELQAQAAKFLFYVVFFAIVFTYVSVSSSFCNSRDFSESQTLLSLSLSTECPSTSSARSTYPSSSSAGVSSPSTPTAD